MTINRQSAEKIIALFNEASALCDDSLRTIKRNENLGHVQVYGRLAGQFLGDSYMNILAPIWKTFPDLEPPEMKTPYIEPPMVLTPESESALKAFLAVARSAIESTKHLATSGESEILFSYGGLPEVEQAVAAIENFLEKPSYRDEIGGQ